MEKVFENVIRNTYYMLSIHFKLHLNINIFKGLNYEERKDKHTNKYVAGLF